MQFGEGGAGTFSDGKLNTGVNNPRIGWILEQFVKAGAREDILYDAKPHVGTDVLLTVVQNLRKRIQELGGEVRFETRVERLKLENGVLRGVVTDAGEEIPCNHCVLAIGHSARDTFRMLEELGVPMEPKPFAMGARIEQKQEKINLAQYGKENPALPPADYKLVEHLDNETVYTFCMCPGGVVVASSSGKGQVVTNGMSYHARDGRNANAAIVVSVNTSDFANDPLQGLCFQEKLERDAFLLGGGSYFAPAERLYDFMHGAVPTGFGEVTPTYRPGVKAAALEECLPDFIAKGLYDGLSNFGHKIAGFDMGDAVLTAVETRTSSPVRIQRTELGEATQMQGLFPVGEGAGYAGGIVSAAVDGMRAAERIIAIYSEA